MSGSDGRRLWLGFFKNLARPGWVRCAKRGGRRCAATSIPLIGFVLSTPATGPVWVPCANPGAWVRCVIRHFSPNPFRKKRFFFAFRPSTHRHSRLGNGILCFLSYAKRPSNNRPIRPLNRSSVVFAEEAFGVEPLYAQQNHRRTSVARFSNSMKIVIQSDTHSVFAARLNREESSPLAERVPGLTKRASRYSINA
jgi:hypothetical protein